MTEVNNSMILKLHDSLIKFQRKRRFIALRFGIPSDQAGESLGFTEEAILIVLNAEPEKNVKELAEALNLERSWMSRVISALEEKGLVESYVPESDRRSKKLMITETGKQKLYALHETSKKIMDMATEKLDAEQATRFCAYLARFANAMGAPQYPSSDNNHPADTQLARISRAAGILSDNVVGSGFSVTQLQVLMVLAEGEGCEIVTSDVDEMLPFDMSTVSRTIANFEKQNLVQKVQSEHDKRSYTLHLTEEGVRKVSEYHMMVGEHFKPANNEFTDAEMNDFVGIVEELTADMPQISQRSIRDRIEVKELPTSDYEADAMAAGESSAQFGIFQNGELKGKSEITRSSMNGGISQLTLSGPALNNKLAMVLLRSSLERTA